MKYDTIVIGAGAAGLMAASFLDRDVLVLEKNEFSGSKILVSGKGQCNFTHNGNITDFFNKYGDKTRFVRYALSKFSNKDLIDFFEQRNMEYFIREDGKVFPRSLDAQEIVDILEASVLRDKRKSIEYNEPVRMVEKKADEFVIATRKKVYHSKNLIIATGGRTYPKTGTTGDGYSFAKALQVPVTKLQNGLCGVKIKAYQFIDISGLTLEDVFINCYRNNKKIEEFIGDLLFTHDGLSGPVVLNNARYLKEDDRLEVNFMKKNFSQMREELIQLINQNSSKNMINVIKLLGLPENLVDQMFSDLPLTKNAANIDKKTRKEIIKRLTAYPFEIKKVGTLHNSMVTVGGINTKKIHPKKMSYREDSNLYFVGEVLDVDGNTGGYNLQWAFSSGVLAARDINSK